MEKTRSSVVGIAIVLHVRWSGVRMPVEKNIVSWFRTSRPALGPTQSWSSNMAFPGVKPSVREVKLFPPSSAEFKNEWSFTCKPLYMVLWSGQRSLYHYRKNISEFVCHNLQGKNTDETRKLIESKWNNKIWPTDKVNLWVGYSFLVAVKWKVGGREVLCKVLYKKWEKWNSTEFFGWGRGRNMSSGPQRGLFLSHISLAYFCFVLRHDGGDRQFLKGSGCKLIKSLPVRK